MSDTSTDPNRPQDVVALGVSGRIARMFFRSQLTPLLALVGLLSGLFAAGITPREEEPQIDVTMANVFVPFVGANVGDVESQVTVPMEKVLAEIEQVDHVFSVSRPGMSVLTVQFRVGVPRTEALVKLYNAIYSNQDWRPANLGIGRVLVKPGSIDDVSVLDLTLWTRDPARGAFDLQQIAHALETELQRVPGTRKIETIGSASQVVRVLLDPEKLASHQLSISELRQVLLLNNTASQAGAVIGADGYIPVQAGEYFTTPDELAELVVGMDQGRPVFLQDVADVVAGPAENNAYVWHAEKNLQEHFPAVTLAIGKKPGQNAVEITGNVLKRVDQLKGTLIPDGVGISVTRNYGVTANEKANTLIKKLFFATASVVLLVLLALGWREAVVVGAAVVLTLMMTLFASWAWGFTLNRVSLFALIFSIGILVDDAIVVVENIHRHMRHGNTTLLRAIPVAVDEVGGPTILATFTVIAALLPMAFVSGLMGPYMSPIPINASMGMLISLLVAFTFTPWLYFFVMKSQLMTNPSMHAVTTNEHAKSGTETLQRFFTRLMTPLLGAGNRRNRYVLGGVLVALIFVSVGMAVAKLVVLKMLPFDNKSEFQVVVDMPEGTPVENTNRVLSEMVDYLLTVPEVVSAQAYAGTAAPIGFNGLVRQYYLRQSPQLGDIQVNLQDKHHRQRDSHSIARETRASLTAIAARHQAVVKVVEVPPGPPVMAPLVAEVYGPDYAGQINIARSLRAEFEKTEGLVDIDDSIENNASRLVVVVDRSRAAQLGVAPGDVVAAIAASLGGEDVTYLHDTFSNHPVPVRLELGVADKSGIDRVLSVHVRSRSGALVPLSEVTQVRKAEWENTIYHKDLLPVVYVTADMAGKLDSPLYGMFDVVGKLGNSLQQFFIRQPSGRSDYSVKWDGEWQITYETFRDMGAAYSVGLLLIFLLVVAQFRSYAVPLVIMAPIAFTLIGILPGHALLGAQFTATSMIGMIALAGIIVRNSILLVDFMNQAIATGATLEDAVISAASVRAKPIILTALAAMTGAFFILDDPIFNGLAISLIFGLLVSTMLTLVVIPLLYYSLLRRRIV
ncbi:MAG TPA: efflux RND transporter permease subunit [Pseudomonadales bacterium]|nr:efflux RND transporter permease subunit [Pseudomonadales bacterium]